VYDSISLFNVSASLSAERTYTNSSQPFGNYSTRNNVTLSGVGGVVGDAFSVNVSRTSKTPYINNTAGNYTAAWDVATTVRIGDAGIANASFASGISSKQGFAIIVSGSRPYPCRSNTSSYSLSGTLYLNMESDAGLSLVAGLQGTKACDFSAVGVDLSVSATLPWLSYAGLNFSNVQLAASYGRSYSPVTCAAVLCPFAYPWRVFNASSGLDQAAGMYSKDQNKTVLGNCIAEWNTSDAGDLACPSNPGEIQWYKSSPPATGELPNATMYRFLNVSMSASTVRATSALVEEACHPLTPPPAFPTFRAYTAAATGRTSLLQFLHT